MEGGNKEGRCFIHSVAFVCSRLFVVSLAALRPPRSASEIEPPPESPENIFGGRPGEVERLHVGLDCNPARCGMQHGSPSQSSAL